MAVDETESMVFTGVAPNGVIPSALQEAGYGFYYPRDAADFFLQSRSRDGRLTSLDNCILSMQWDESLEDVVTSGTLELDNSLDVNGVRISQFVDKGSELTLMIRNPVSGRLEEKDRFVVFRRRRTSDGTMVCTFYDYMKYLADSKVTVLYTTGKRKRAWNAREITKDLCTRYGIKLAMLPSAKKDIPYFYQEEESLLDILIRLWTIEAKASGQRFILRMVRGVLHVVPKPKNPQSQVLELSNDENDAGILTEMAVEDSIEGVVTVLRLWGTRKEFADGTPDTRQAVVKSRQYASKSGVAAWGRIYLEKPMPGIITAAEINRQAAAEIKRLSKPTTDIDCEIIGYPAISAGTPIRVRERSSGANGLYWFKTLSHSISGDGGYTARGNLTAYDFTETLATDVEDLSPDSTSTDGAPGGPLGSMAKTNAIPKDVWNTLRAASAKAGVPQQWANSKALEQLLQHESGFSFTAKNPSSTAYGLFQFLDSTWDNWDTGVKKEQAIPSYPKTGAVSLKVEGIGWVAKWKYNMCVAGLKYVKKKYGSPEKAWAYWQEHRSY